VRARRGREGRRRERGRGGTGEERDGEGRSRVGPPKLKLAPQNNFPDAGAGLRTAVRPLLSVLIVLIYQLICWCRYCDALNNSVIVLHVHVFMFTISIKFYTISND